MVELIYDVGLVGDTGLEPVTSRTPCARATNCANPRLIFKNKHDYSFTKLFFLNKIFFASLRYGNSLSCGFAVF